MRFIRFLCSVFVGLFFLAACGDTGPVKIGFIAGLSGPGSDAGNDALNALKLAAKQVNDTGGINGRMIEIIPRDDQKSPEIAQNHVREFKELGVEAHCWPHHKFDWYGDAASDQRAWHCHNIPNHLSSRLCRFSG